MQREIETILSNLVVDNKKIPYAFHEYNGKETTYVTYQEISSDIYYADDYPVFIVSTYDFDIYSKKNYLKIEEKLKKILIESDWVWVEDNETEFETDTRYFHKTITFRKEKNYG